MTPRTPALRLADGFIDLLAALLRGVSSLALLARLWRLISLRAQSSGDIPVHTQFDGPVTATGTGFLRLGAHCRLGRDVHFDTVTSGRITLGEHVRVNAGGVIAAADSVTIGDDTLIGEYVSIRDADHGLGTLTLMRSQPLYSEPISIGRNVWIGRGCCILKGVTIGDGAVIGANSIVTHDVPPNTIQAGVPAREIGKRPAKIDPVSDQQNVGSAHRPNGCSGLHGSVPPRMDTLD